MLRRILFITAIIAGLIAPASIASATSASVPAPSNASETIAFEALLTTTEMGEPDREWFSGPIYHVRDIPLTDVWTGGLEGTMHRWVSFDMNLETGHNTARCRTELNMTAPLEETFDVRCRGTLLTGSFNGRGSEGSILTGTYALAPGGTPGVGPYETQGTILVPAGR